VAEAEKGYGTLPVEEFDRLRAERDKGVQETETMREDWDIGLKADGEFYVSFGAKCVEKEGGCGFEFAFEHKEQAEPARDQ
jgi:hypothetical protein